MNIQTPIPTVTSSKVTFDDVLLIGERCFGALGRKTVFLWKQYNDAYFGGSLDVTPVLYVPTSPYGHWVGLHCPSQNIYLMFPGNKRSWGYVRGVLLHEMIHQGLAQEGKDSAHACIPWCSEIMRISKYFDRDIWAGKYTVRRVNGKSKRVNQAPLGSTDAHILNQGQISRWPHSIGIEPPDTCS